MFKHLSKRLTIRFPPIRRTLIFLGMFTVEVRVGQCTDLAPHRAGDRSNTGRMRIMAQMTGKVAIVLGAATRDNMRSEERRVGNARARTCRSLWSPSLSTKTK